MRTPDGKIVILDFGLMTEVSEDQRIALVEYIAHLTLEDWEGVARDLVHLGKQQVQQLQWSACTAISSLFVWTVIWAVCHLTQ